ncbi:MAG: hypothetical protein IKV55_06005 [Oscillospiraceae bacterium]|nr:hypothetical protein [Oscillospiraceae bacterium]
MKKKFENVLLLLLCGGLWLALSIFAWLKPADSYSNSERRALETLPAFSLQSFFAGDYTADFTSAAADQFPLRESFRALKANAAYRLFQLRDNNGIYLADGHLSKLEYPMSDSMLQHAQTLFRKVYDKYVANSGCRVYFSIVPDKNAYLAAANGYPALDYAALETAMRAETDAYMQYIDIAPLLQLSDYYTTDSHWRQECITDVAEALGSAMGADVRAEYTQHTLDTPFYGVWAGQAALNVPADSLSYLTSDVLDGCSVFCSKQAGVLQDMPLYDMEKAAGKDPYEMYLGGAEAFVVLENPACDSGRELVIFRDSFGSAIAPLLLEGYSRVTLVDLRYLRSDWLGEFIEFNGQDVLFLYSTMLLNSSLAMQ